MPPAVTSDENLTADQIRERILDAIADEARLAAAEGVATPDVIDLALRLGAGHPHGPFESRPTPT